MQPCSLPYRTRGSIVVLEDLKNWCITLYLYKLYLFQLLQREETVRQFCTNFALHSFHRTLRPNNATYHDEKGLETPQETVEQKLTKPHIKYNGLMLSQ